MRNSIWNGVLKKGEVFKNCRCNYCKHTVNREIFYPFYRQHLLGFNLTIEQEQARYRVNSEIERFLFNPNKPLILSIGRADKRKNFETIIQSYGQDKELQAMRTLQYFQV